MTTVMCMHIIRPLKHCFKCRHLANAFRGSRYQLTVTENRNATVLQLWIEGHLVGAEGSSIIAQGMAKIDITHTGHIVNTDSFGGSRIEHTSDTQARFCKKI